jgi:hypothetical protein
MCCMNTSRRLHPLIERLKTPPPFFPAIEIPTHLRKPSKGLSKRLRLLLWWLTYRLGVEKPVDDLAIKEAAEKTRLSPQDIWAAKADYPVHWERMFLKRTLRLNHQRKHGSVPNGINPRLAARTQRNPVRSNPHPKATKPREETPETPPLTPSLPSELTDPPLPASACHSRN